jgi:hypothetical protein
MLKRMYDVFSKLTAHLASTRGWNLHLDSLNLEATVKVYNLRARSTLFHNRMDVCLAAQ